MEMIWSVVPTLLPVLQHEATDGAGTGVVRCRCHLWFRRRWWCRRRCMHLVAVQLSLGLSGEGAVTARLTARDADLVEGLANGVATSPVVETAVLGGSGSSGHLQHVRVK